MKRCDRRKPQPFAFSQRGGAAVRTWTAVGASVLALMAAACGDGADHGHGSVRVQLEAESTIADGLEQGDDVHDARDYGVTYSKFLVAVGHITLGRDGQEVHDEHVYIADLKQVGTEGIELTVFEDLEAGQWHEFGYSTPAAGASAEPLQGVSDEDAQEMIEHGWTYWIEGTVHRPEDEGGPVDFTIQTDAETEFHDCRADGELGVAVPEDRTATAIISLHGDHLWFNGFNLGSEETIERRTGWIIEADLDEDGLVTTEELAQADASEVLAGYDLTGAPGGAEHPIETALDFARAQLATQGHFKGEGECVWSFGGEEGEHEHEHEEDHDHE